MERTYTQKKTERRQNIVAIVSGENQSSLQKKLPPSQRCGYNEGPIQLTLIFMVPYLS